MAPCRKLLGPQVEEEFFSSMVSVMSYDEWLHSSSPLKRRPVSLSSCCSNLASLSAPAKVVAASSFLLALTFTSLHTRVWDSKIHLFRDAVFPGFNGIWDAAMAATVHLLAPAPDGRQQMPALLTM